MTDRSYNIIIELDIIGRRLTHAMAIMKLFRDCDVVYSNRECIIFKGTCHGDTVWFEMQYWPHTTDLIIITNM